MGRVGHLSFISLDVYCHGRSRGVWRSSYFGIHSIIRLLYVSELKTVARFLVYAGLCAYTWRCSRLSSRPVFESSMLHESTPIGVVAFEELPFTCPLAVYTS